MSTSIRKKILQRNNVGKLSATFQTLVPSISCSILKIFAAFTVYKKNMVTNIIWPSMTNQAEDVLKNVNRLQLNHSEI